MSIPKNVLKAGCGVDFSVADPDYFDTDRDPTISKGNVPESVLFIHLNFIFLVGRSARTQPADISCKIFPSNSFFALIRVSYGFGSEQIIRIQTDKAVILTFFVMYIRTGTVQAVVGEVPTKRSSDHDPMIRHCRIIGRFEPKKQNCRIIALKFDI